MVTDQIWRFLLVAVLELVLYWHSLVFPLGRSEGMQNRKTGKATLKRGRSWGHIGILQLHCDSVWELLGAVAEVSLCEYHEFCLLISLLSCVPEWGLLHISLFLWRDIFVMFVQDPASPPLSAKMSTFWDWSIDASWQLQRLTVAHTCCSEFSQPAPPASSFSSYVFPLLPPLLLMGEKIDSKDMEWPEDLPFLPLHLSPP